MPHASRAPATRHELHVWDAALPSTEPRALCRTRLRARAAFTAATTAEAERQIRPPTPTSAASAPMPPPREPRVASTATTPASATRASAVARVDRRPPRPTAHAAPGPGVRGSPGCARAEQHTSRADGRPRPARRGTDRERVRRRRWPSASPSSCSSRSRLGSALTGRSVSAVAIACSTARALLRVSCSSLAGTLSATTPARPARRPYRRASPRFGSRSPCRGRRPRRGNPPRRRRCRAHRLDLVDELHRPHLRRAGQRARRERGREARRRRPALGHLPLTVDTMCQTWL